MLEKNNQLLFFSVSLKTFLQNLLLFLSFGLLFFIYVVFCFSADSRNIFLATPRSNQYNLLLESFVHGRLNVVPHITDDLSFYKEKWYLYWGPAPVLFIFPFFLMSGVGASARYYTFIAGIENVILFYLVILQLKKFFHLRLSLFHELFLLLSFGICSANFYLSFVGGIWSTPAESIIAMFYLLFCFLFYFLFLNNKKNLLLLALSVIFFNLAWLSRYAMVFQIVIFGYLFFCEEFSEWKKKIQLFLIIIVITSFFSLLFLLYNYARFGNSFETGFQYQNNGAVLHNNHLFSTVNIGHNFYVYFLKFPSFIYPYHPPYLAVDWEGDSIFVFYPALLLLVFLIRKKYFQNKHKMWFIIFSAVGVVSTMFFLLCYFSTGWVQFGSRFFLDIMPLCLFLVAFALEDIPLSFLLLVLIYGLSVNFLGTFSMIKSLTY